MSEAEPMIAYMKTLDGLFLAEYKQKVINWETRTETYRIARAYLLDAIAERE